MGKLTAKEVRAALSKGEGRTLQDGDGLMLKVDKRGGASWLLRVQRSGKRQDIGLGSAGVVSLAEARVAAGELRKAIKIEGRDVLAERKVKLAAEVTFAKAADDWIATHGKQLSLKHTGQVRATLNTYAMPVLGNMRVGEITAADIARAIKTVWVEKPETGRRVRHRVCAVLTFAHGQGWRAAEAPYKALEAGRGILPRQAKGSHHRAMPWEEIPDFLPRLRAAGGTWTRLALEFLILTAARSGEVRGATWDEIDLETRTWTVPASRMKVRKEHVVPLSDAALAVLRIAGAVRLAGTDLVFPGNGGTALSDNSLMKCLKRLGVADVATVHGFRSSFRTWAAEATAFPGEVAERALAHKVPNAVEAAYRRASYLVGANGQPGKRVALMAAWGAYVSSSAAGDNVVPLQQVSAA